MSLQHRLDFDRINVESLVDNQILGPSDDDEVSIHQLGEIASIEPSLGIDGSGGFFRRPVIALHHVRTTHSQFTDATSRNWLTIASYELYLDAWKHSAD